jgi:hypothetical protein
MGLWLGLAGLLQFREGRGGGVVLVASAIVTGVLVILYSVGLESPPDHPPSVGPVAALTVAGQFLGMGFGPFGQAGWPFTLVAVLALLGAAAWRLAGRWKTAPDERTATAGAAAFLASMVLVSLSVGLTRSGHPVYGDGAGYGFASRYATLAAPLLAGTFLIWALPGPGWLWGRLQALLLVVAVALVPYNARTGLGSGNSLRALEDALMRDIRSGMEPRRVAARHWPWFLCREKEMVAGLEMMKERSYGPYGPRAGR